MSGLFQIMGVIFIIVGLVQNKEENYWKKISFSIMILSIFSALYFLPYTDKVGGTIYLGLWQIKESTAPSIYRSSLIIGMLSFIIFLFSDTK